MSRLRAAIGSALFLVLAPGLVTIAVPWLLTGFDTHAVSWISRAVGIALIALGTPVVLQAYARFVWEGLGTPAPVAPPSHLVVGGVYRHVRNPMYVAITAIILGEALLLGRPVLVLWAAVFVAATIAFVRLYEEPHLRGLFGDEYEEYRRNVPGWWPRLRPWRG
jgi:protein-S-isoprenylcysteine O-methyltransferase Ste14